MGAPINSELLSVATQDFSKPDIQHPPYTAPHRFIQRWREGFIKVQSTTFTQAVNAYFERELDIEKETAMLHSHRRLWSLLN